MHILFNNPDRSGIWKTTDIIDCNYIYKTPDNRKTRCYDRPETICMWETM